ncbi:MAG: guanine deaminase, partial [Pseudomonadota bacterium]
MDQTNVTLMPSSPAPRLIVLGDLLDFPRDPGFAPPPEAEQAGAVRWRPDHRIRIEAGRILAVEPADRPLPADWAQVPVHDHRGQLVLPGFIDTHVHCPQLDVIASFGTELLDWLNTYTFPAERRYVDPAVSQAGAERFLNALWAHGTTAAVVFPTVHKVSAEALFERASQAHMRLVTGKVLMDRHAPDGLRDDVAGADADTHELVARWHG